MDGGAWWATVHGAAKSWTRLSDFTFFLFFLQVDTSEVLLCFFFAFVFICEKEKLGLGTVVIY